MSRVCLETPFSAPVTFATPTSFLVDEQGKLAAIYRGETKVDQIIADCQLLKDSALARGKGTPFEGRWFNQPALTDILRIPREMVDRGEISDASFYVLANRDRLKRSKEFARLAVWIGDELTNMGQSKQALAIYEIALEANSNELVVLNNVAWQLATNSDSEVRDGKRAVVLALKAARQTKFERPSILATLAASYAEAGDFPKAVRTCNRAIELARRVTNSDLEQKLIARLKLFQSNQPFRSKP